MRKVFLLMIGLGGTGVFGIAFVLRKLRADAEKMSSGNQILAEQTTDLIEAKWRLEEANESIRKRADQQQQMQRGAINIMKDTDRYMQQLKQTNLELENLQQEHLETARKAGMAEVATGVLHNVGNVLNSVNVSANLLTERLVTGRVDNLQKAVAMLEEHSDDPGTFLTHDEKGRRLPTYLSRLADVLGDDCEFIQGEVASLNEKVEHIKDIVQVQQSYAQSGGHLETVELSELIETALRVNGASLERHGIEIVREFGDAASLITDKHKVLQIIVNLISNAKNAIDEHDGEVRRLTLRTTNDGGMASIQICDTGLGIAPENLDRIFGHGFTTRESGHGFGLHSSANAAADLHGSLSVSSDGPGCGATFTLQLPMGQESACPAS